MLINELVKRKNSLELLIERIAKQVASAPGHVRTCRKGNKTYYLYTEPGKKERYLRVEEIDIAKRIVQSEYDQKMLRAAKKQLSAVKRMIRLLEHNDLCSIYSGLHSSRKDLVKPFIEPADIYTEKWLARSYSGKGFSDNEPVHTGPKGERMRSKSECMIAGLLLRLGIPYLYEYPVKVKGYGIIYADFLLLNEHTREEYILEHFGMTDNPDYVKKMFRKLDTYAEGGIFPGRNLLMSFESSARPVDLRLLEKELQTFFSKEC